MKRLQQIALQSLACAVVASCGQIGLTQELLLAPGFEVEAGEVPSWELEEFRTGDPGNLVNSGQLVGFANNPGGTDGETGLWLRAFVGNLDDGTAEMILSQTVAATAGETYSFSGEASFEQNYAGGVAFLDPLSPFGAIESPTESLFELAFLDSAGDVIGSPIVKDVSESAFNGFGYQPVDVTPTPATAPAGTVSARVRAIGSALAFNVDPGQTAFYDNFSLTAGSAPSTELLANANLNDAPASAEDFYDFIETPEGADTVNLQGFANNPATGGSTGAWVRPFIADGESAVVAQTVPGSVGTDYVFEAASRFEVAYLGDGSLTDENETLIELAFLDEGGEVIEMVTLDLRDDGKTADNEWSTHSVMGTAPAGTIEVRVAGIVNNLTNNEEGGAQSAFWDDFSLMAATAGLPGDYNSDGTVDAIDYTVWRDGGSPDSSEAGYTLWANNYGATNSATAIPEPASALLVVLALGATAARRRV